jgi:beta-lactamase class A
MIYDYGPTYYYARSKNSRQKIFYTLIIFFVLTGIAYFTFFKIILSQTNNKAVAGAIIHAAPTAISSPVPSQPPAQNTKLAAVVENALLNTKGNYGIVILNLNTNEFYLRNEHRQFTAASLYKLWVMAAALEQIDNNSLSQDQILTADIDSLYEKFNVASPSAKSSISISVQKAIEKMITISDNTTALLLSSKIKLSNIKNFLDKNAFVCSKLGTVEKEPITCAYDIAMFYKKIYHGELVNSQTSAYMIELLKKQRLNGKLPKYLPDGITIAHKTGELGSFTHDAGIVYTDSGEYLIVVLSESDPQSRLMAEDRIARVSKAVYKYFTSAN